MFGRLDTYDDSQASTHIAANDVKYEMLSLWRSGEYTNDKSDH